MYFLSSIFRRYENRKEEGVGESSWWREEGEMRKEERWGDSKRGEGKEGER